MEYVMSGSSLAAKALRIATRFKTLYVMGCFGAPMNDKNKKRYTDNHDYNRDPKRVAMINSVSTDTFGFDCVCLIKGILWGWSGDVNAQYGGAAYSSNGVPDIGTESMIRRCPNHTSDFSNIVCGEVLWTDGHVGIYIGDGLAVECTPGWDNCVQVTAVHNIGKNDRYNGRYWKEHGKLPWVNYDGTRLVVGYPNRCFMSMSNAGNGYVGPLSDLGSFNSSMTVIEPWSVLEKVDLTPLMVTVGEKTTSVNYAKLKEIGVVGTLIEAGKLYDSIHMERATFKTSTLDKQVADAKSADMPFGLYMHAQARSVQEAKKEMQRFSTLIKKHSPKLGAWLELDLIKSKDINNAIVDEYHKLLTNIGMANSMGLYVTRNQLSCIDWDKHCDKWLLWLVDPLPSLDDIDRIVAPPMFTLDTSDDIGSYLDVDNLNLYLSTGSTQISLTKQKQTLKYVDSSTKDYLDYVLYIPKGATTHMPVVVFLHGSGSVGMVGKLDDNAMMNNAQSIYGNTFPFIAIVPNTRSDWHSSKVVDTLIGLIDMVTRKLSCDRSKIIISGHSLGGLGTWGLLSRYGDYFSAAVPISAPSSGNLNYTNVCKVPIWGFVGTSGDTENKYRSQMENIIGKVKDLGGYATLTVLQGSSHGQADNRTFTKETFEWMISQ